MPDRAAYVQVATGEPRREWCGTCLTSARLTVDVYVLADDGPHQIGTRSGCTRCDPHLY